MSDSTKYISRRNALNRVEKLRPVKMFYDSSDEFQAAMHIFNEVKNELAHTRIEKDVARVIHCSECKYYRPFPDGLYGQCTHLCKTATVEKPTDYCSHAETKAPPLPEHDDHSVSGLLDE